MRIYQIDGKTLYPRLQRIEQGLSWTRKTKTAILCTPLSLIEEISPIRQAKREHLPVYAHFSGKALINLDDERLFWALEEGVIDEVIDDTPLLAPFLEEARYMFKLFKKIPTRPKA